MITGLLQHLSLTLRLNFRSKQAIIYGYVVPIFFLFALGSVFASNPPLRSDMGRLLTVTILGGACFGMPTTMVAERERGVWRRYRLLPAATGGIILSAMVARFVIILSAAVMQIILARLIYKTPFPEHPIDMLGAFIFVCFAFLGLGLVIAMISDNVPAVQAMGQAIFLPLIIIGGVGVRFQALPHWCRHVARFLPGIYAVDSLQFCQAGPGLIAGRLDLVALTVIGLAAILAGAKLFRWDVGQKLSGPAKGWVALAIVGWLLVGLSAEFGERVRAAIAVESSPTAVTQFIIPQPQETTRPATTESVKITPPSGGNAPWQNVTAKEIDSITYDDLPDDGGTVAPLAADLNSLDDDGRKRMENLNDALSDWAPGQVEDIPQRVRNLLSLCAVADIVEDQHEGQIPYVVFNYMRANIQKDQLPKAVAWVVLNPDKGTVLTNIKDIKELGIDGEVPEDTVRERSMMYGKKLLFRLLKKG